MFKIAVMISGRGSNFKAILDATKNNDWPIKVCVVLTDNPKAEGLKFAEENKIPIAIVQRRAKEQTKEKFNSLLAEALKPYQPDLVVLAGFMRILTTEFIGEFSNKIVNIHPSLLPDFRGLDAQKQAFDAGVKTSGCTVHFVNEELDGGPIISQIKVPVLETDTVEDLSARILKQEHQLYPKAIYGIATGQIQLTNGEVKIAKDFFN